MDDPYENAIKTVFSKMQYDSWPNIVILNNGNWFVADEMNSSEPLPDTTFLDFSFSSVDCDPHFDILCKRNCLNLLTCKRNICVNVN